MKVGDKVTVKKGTRKSPSQRHYEKTANSTNKFKNDVISKNSLKNPSVFEIALSILSKIKQHSTTIKVWKSIP